MHSQKHLSHPGPTTSNEPPPQAKSHENTTKDQHMEQTTPDNHSTKTHMHHATPSQYYCDKTA
jgi:hypothetical protein